MLQRIFSFILPSFVTIYQDFQEFQPVKRPRHRSVSPVCRSLSTQSAVYVYDTHNVIVRTFVDGTIATYQCTQDEQSPRSHSCPSPAPASQNWRYYPKLICFFDTPWRLFSLTLTRRDDWNVLGRFPSNVDVRKAKDKSRCDDCSVRKAKDKSRCGLE